MKKKVIIKDILKIVVFLFLLLLIMMGLSIVFRPKDNTKESGTHNYGAKAIYTEKENTIDVVAIGASNFWCGYSPMEIYNNQGYTSYNCGTLMQQIWYSYYFLEEIYKEQTPKVLLFDVDVLFLENSSTVDNINDMIKYTLNWKLPATEYHNRWKTLSPAEFTTDVQNTNDNIMKGFYYVNQTQGNANEEDDFMDQDFENEEITFLDRYYLQKIQELCAEHGTKLVFVEAPAELAWNDVRRDAVTNYADENGIDFIDSNAVEIGMDWDTDTRDGGYHLNYNGAKKFTNFVEDYLVNNCELEDHRNDPAYSKWNDDLATYLQKVQK